MYIFCIFWHFVSFFDKLEFSELGMQIILKKKKIRNQRCDNFFIYPLLSSSYGMRPFRMLAISFSILTLSTGPNQSPRFLKCSRSSLPGPLFFSSIVELLFVATGIWCKYSMHKTYYFKHILYITYIGYQSKRICRNMICDNRDS